ncbi:MAG: polyamine aminopropyltransferase [Alphaproteobacteria bacterium]
MSEQRRGLDGCETGPRWYEESLDPDLRQRLRITEVLHHEKTAHHDLMIFENPSLGRVLALDGAIQTTEGDEYVYHEMLVHTPIIGHGQARRVLIVGGGDGGALREALRHQRIEHATLVDIDESVIALSRKYLPKINAGSFDDPRAEIVIADGARFVHETDARFDIVIVDSTDPIGPGEALFSESFYAGCRRCLAPGGILVTQSGVPAVQGIELTQSHRRLSVCFNDVAFYLAPVPTYHGGFMAFGWASDDAGVRATPLATIEARYAAAGITTRYYNPEIHRAAFALPNDVKALMR